MKAEHSEGQSPKRVGRFRVIQLQAQWYVVGPGHMSMVDGYAEGVQLIEKLRAEDERHRLSAT